MEHQEPALDLLKKRFALRLAAALDAAGYPVLQAARVRALATALGLDASLATAFLSGLHVADYAELLALCALLDRQPGYFLDEQVLDVPPGTTLVKPMLNGEDLVLRLPSEVLSASDARKGLRYWRTPAEMGFGIAAGEYLVALAPAPRAAPRVDRLYLLSGPHGIDVVRCADVHSDRAVFHTAAGGQVPLIVSSAARERGAGALSRLIASVRCGESLHVRS